MLDVCLWLVDLDPAGHRLEFLRTLLDPEERARADRFVPPAVRRRFTVARGALREILGSLLGVAPAEVRFAYGDRGKPELPGVSLRFNLSHSEERALVGVVEGRAIGVDLEHLRAGEDFRGLAERFFSEPERQELRRVPEPSFRREFLRIWTRKEAYLKARGTGLAMPLGDFAVPLGDLPGPAAMTWARGHAEEAQAWRLQEVDCGQGYVGALCLEGGGWRAAPPVPWTGSPRGGSG